MTIKKCPKYAVNVNKMPTSLKTRVEGETMVTERIMCESCNERPSTGHCQNPDYVGYNLCDECMAEYDSRPHGIIEAGNT